MTFMLTNLDRRNLGLDPIEDHWEVVNFRKDRYRPESLLVYEGDTIKKHIIAEENSYFECQLNEQTENRELLLPRTNRGKPQKLSPATLEKRQPYGVYFRYDGEVCIANFSTQTTLYSSRMEKLNMTSLAEFRTWLDSYNQSMTSDLLAEIDNFRIARRKHVAYRPGDYFVFRVSHNRYGAGRILEDITPIKEEYDFPLTHNLGALMGRNLLIAIYPIISSSPDFQLKDFREVKLLPSQIIMDNQFYYGEHEIIGHEPVRESELDFPMSVQYVQGGTFHFSWGMMYFLGPDPDLSEEWLDGYENLKNREERMIHFESPFSCTGSGHNIDMNLQVLLECVQSKSSEPYFKLEPYKIRYDLRNPEFNKYRVELLEGVGLDPAKSYFDNLQLYHAML